jgi:RIO kinase 1
MINNGTLASMKSHFASGKESKVYTALTRSGELVAVKIFLTVSAEFKNRMRYIAGDPRFEGIKKGSTRELISAWARKEFRNLQAATKCGVSVPHPISVRKNVLVMDFVEADDNDEEAKDSRRPAGSIADGNVNSEDYFFVMKQVELLYQCAELVHADLSEYNILKTRAGKLVLIDFGSAVSARHPNSKQFLLRDLINLNRFFLKWGIETVDPAFALRTITGVSAS